MCSKTAVSYMRKTLSFQIYILGVFFPSEHLILKKGGAGYTLHVSRGACFSITSLIAELSFCWAISQIGPYFVCLCVGLCQDHRIHGTEHACNGLLTLGGFK